MIACVVATYKRYKITAETIKVLKKQTVPVRVIVVGSDNIDKKVCKIEKVDYVFCRNEYLSNKWQYGMNAARKLDPDGVLICGSDSWVSPNWCEVCTPYLEEYDLIGKNRFWALKMYPYNPLFLRHFGYEKDNIHPIGSGRIWSKKFLEKIDWKLFPKGFKKGLDAQSFANLEEHKGKVKIIDSDKIVSLALKGDWLSKSSWKTYNESFQHYSAIIKDKKYIRNWLEKHFPDSIKALKRIESTIEV